MVASRLELLPRRLSFRGFRIVGAAFASAAATLDGLRAIRSCWSSPITTTGLGRFPGSRRLRPQQFLITTLLGRAREYRRHTPGTFLRAEPFAGSSARRFRALSFTHWIHGSLTYSRSLAWAPSLRDQPHIRLSQGLSPGWSPSAMGMEAVYSCGRSPCERCCDAGSGSVVAVLIAGLVVPALLRSFCGTGPADGRCGCRSTCSDTRADTLFVGCLGALVSGWCPQLFLASWTATAEC
jgi:hypothetical protein